MSSAMSGMFPHLLNLFQKCQQCHKNVHLHRLAQGVSSSNKYYYLLISDIHFCIFKPIKHNEQQQRQEKYNPHCHYIPI